MSRISIFPPVATVYPNDRQLFTARATPPPAMWTGVTDSGDIKSDFSLEVDPAGSTMSGFGGHRLFSGIGIVEFTIDDQCRPTAANEFHINGFIFDVAGFLYKYSLQISATAVEVRNEADTQIFTEAYSTVSGDVYRLELNAGFRFYRNGVLKHSRVGLGTTVIYPMEYQAALTESTAAAPTRIPAPRLIGDWRCHFNVVWTAPSHGSISAVQPGLTTDYFGGTVPGLYTLIAAMEAAADAGNVQRATATIVIPPLQILGSTEITLQPSQKVRFKTNYDAAQTALIAWSVASGGGSFTQDEYTAPSAPSTSIARATASVNGQVADITITVPAVVTNANGYTAAKPSEQIDFDTNIPIAPSFVSSGPVAHGTGNIVPALPPGIQLNDILLMFIETANENVGAPSGWNSVADSPQGTGTIGGVTSTGLTIFWRRVTLTETAPTIVDPGDHAIALILAFRNCFLSGNPWDVTSGDVQGSTSTSVSIPGDTTTVANCLVVLAVANMTDTLTPQTAGFTNADLTNLTELTDVSTDQGNGGGFAVAVGQKAVAGAFGATAATLTTASVQARITVALKPAVPAWSASIGSINGSSGLWTAPSLSGQTAKITATNGTLTRIIEIPVLEVFPFDPTAVIKWERRKTVLVSTAEDRSRASRVKDKDGVGFEAWEVTYRNKTVAELATAMAFFEAHFPGKRFIFEDKLRTLRKVVYFDSNISVEAGADCSVDFSFRIVEA